MEYLIATETLHVATDDGIPRTIFAGTPVKSSDPAVKNNPRSFKTADEIAEDEPVAFGPSESPEPTPKKRAKTGPLTSKSVPAP